MEGTLLRCSSHLLSLLFWVSLDAVDEGAAGLAIRAMRAAITGKSSSKPKAAARSSGDNAVNHCRTSF